MMNEKEKRRNDKRGEEQKKGETRRFLEKQEKESSSVNSYLMSVSAGNIGLVNTKGGCQIE